MPEVQVDSDGEAEEIWVRFEGLQVKETMVTTRSGCKIEAEVTAKGGTGPRKVGNKDPPKILESVPKRVSPTRLIPTSRGLQTQKLRRNSMIAC